VKVKPPPGATRPESHTPVSDTMSCVVESVFDHMTAPPCETLAGLGTKAAVPSVLALAGMVMVEDEGAGGGAGAGAGVGDGVGVDELLLPQPAMRAESRSASKIRTWIMYTSGREGRSAESNATANRLPGDHGRNSRYHVSDLPRLCVQRKGLRRMFSQVGASERADHDDAQSRGSSYLERSFYQRLADVPSTEWLGNLRVNQGERLVSPFVREICGVAVNGQLKPLQRRVVRYEHV